MGLKIKTHAGNGHGHNKDVPIPGVPTFASNEEADDWANNAGATALQDLFKAQVDLGEVNFSLDYS